MRDDDVVDLVLESDELSGDGFFRIRRLLLRNRRRDGSLSDRYACEFLVRPKGIDAVVVALFHRPAAGGVRVLLRRGLRPALALGRGDETVPIHEPKPYRQFTELVAGIVEAGDDGEPGVRRRAALEVAEEAGYVVSPDDVFFVGAGVFPSPGSMAEKFWLTAVEIADPAAQGLAEGDGSPMEEGASTAWVDLDEAIAACVRGELEDAKTEILLRRLREHLAG